MLETMACMNLEGFLRSYFIFIDIGRGLHIDTFLNVLKKPCYKQHSRVCRKKVLSTFLVNYTFVLIF